MKKITVFYFLCLMFSLTFLSCQAKQGAEKTPPSSEPSTKAPETTNTAPVPSAAFSLEIYDGQKKKLYFTEKQQNEITIKDGAGKAVAFIVFEGDEAKLKDASKNTLWKIKPGEEEKIKVKDAGGNEVFKIKPKEGGYRIKRGEDETLFKIKPKDNGFKIGDDAGNEHAKSISGIGGEIVIQDAGGKTMYILNGVNTEQASFFALKGYTDIQRIALVTYMALK